MNQALVSMAVCAFVSSSTLVASDAPGHAMQIQGTQEELAGIYNALVFLCDAPSSAPFHATFLKPDEVERLVGVKCCLRSGLENVLRTKKVPKVITITGFSGDDMDLLSRHAKLCFQTWKRGRYAMYVFAFLAPLSAVGIALFDQRDAVAAAELTLLSCIPSGVCLGGAGMSYDAEGLLAPLLTLETKLAPVVARQARARRRGW
jgi:hypothetical protein